MQRSFFSRQVISAIRTAALVVVGASFLLLAGCANDGGSAAGICTYSNNAVLTQSKAGKSATARLQDFARQIQAKLQADRKQVDTKDQKAVAHYNRERKVLNARLQYTKNVVTSRLNKLITPLVNDAYDSRSCTVLLDASSVLRGDQARALTADVTQALDKKVSNVNFELLQLPQNKQSAASKKASQQKDAQAKAGADKKQ